MRVKTLLLLYIFLFSISQAWAEGLDLQWGPRGYDAALQGQASLRYHLELSRDDSSLAEIWVDAQETAGDLREMYFVDASGSVSPSVYCKKRLSDPRAPWGCGFSMERLDMLHGQGKLQFLDHSSRTVLSDAVDFDRIRAALPVRVPILRTLAGNQIPLPPATVLDAEGKSADGTSWERYTTRGGGVRQFFQQALDQGGWRKIFSLLPEDATDCGGDWGGTYEKDGLKIKIHVCGFDQKEASMDVMLRFLGPIEVKQQTTDSI